MINIYVDEINKCNNLSYVMKELNKLKEQNKFIYLNYIVLDL